jgi:hypothetical protein
VKKRDIISIGPHAYQIGREGLTLPKRQSGILGPVIKVEGIKVSLLDNANGPAKGDNGL